MKRIDLNVSQLCEEIDILHDEVQYWKSMYEEEKQRWNELWQERDNEAKKGLKNALLFALSVREGENGSLVIDSESRKDLIDNL